MIRKSENRVVVIDFGLVINYRPDGEGGEHRPLGRYSFQGTPQFGSIRTLQGYNSGRRDDLEGLGYTIMSLIDD
jgi:serine/threonine protein kinase